MQKSIFFIFFGLIFPSISLFAQVDSCVFMFKKHTIKSNSLNESREYWVSLPMHYSDTVQYPVIYLLDAEWRFNLVRNIEFDLAGNKKIKGHIIVGIPHIDWELKRGIDLTFSHSRMEYDGEKVDSTWYNNKNSGGGLAFYEYLNTELIPDVEKNYNTNGENTLIGHSYGGYFGGYILSMNHPFSTIHIYDPSIWFSDGEVIEKIKNGVPKQDKVKIFVSYQPVPEFHSGKIECFIEELKKHQCFELKYRKFEEETHNSLFMPSFLEGIRWTARLEE
ncbi:alpha/beta hydrolase [Flexithrix dorotheae]|uniref:alpha/beta hydrolase n=1 Tax=Flexithrix dorotheae TaxID=70993 RepID=UPI00038196F0|nr:alpha/beta hydrolase-fold protein [Flexithrix dorotheae]